MNEPRMNLPISSEIDKAWTLFLDRDGVVNKRKEGDYIRSVDEFQFLDGVIASLAKLSEIFGLIIIVSNQQGVGKKLMSEEDLQKIHQFLIKNVKAGGGRIDAIYYAPQLVQENSAFRKPNIGMALQAKKDFPQIDFRKSIMVGDSLSDMEFGKKANMITVFLTQNGGNFPNTDFVLENLSQLVL